MLSCVAFSSSDLTGSEGLSGPHADAGPAGTGHGHGPAGAPLPAEEQLAAVPGSPSGAVPQAHVPMLRPIQHPSTLPRSTLQDFCETPPLPPHTHIHCSPARHPLVCRVITSGFAGEFMPTWEL